MDDLISRQAAIDGADAIIARDTSGNNDVVKAMTAWKSYVEALPSAQPEQQWIPCSKRLPEVREWVLCQCREGIVDVLRLTDDGDWNKIYPHAEYMSGFVIAWMPMPKPWKGEKDG